MIGRALSLAFAQLSDRRLIWIFAKSMLITLVLTAALSVLAGYGTSALTDRWAGGALDASSSDVAEGLAGVLVGLGVFIFGFRAVAVPVLGFFGDEVASTVEARHYPGIATKARPASMGVAFRLALLSFVRFLLINLAALPVYIFLLLTAIGPLILFLLINGLLLGRDLGEMVAIRHSDPAAMKQWLANSRMDRALLGLAVTGIFMIPVVNLIAPMLGAAAATHLFHGRRT